MTFESHEVLIPYQYIPTSDRHCDSKPYIVCVRQDMCVGMGVYQICEELTKYNPCPKSTLPFCPAVLDCLPETGVLYLSQSLVHV